MTVTRTIAPRGRFSLGEAIGFGFGGRAADPGADALRMAFVADCYASPTGVVVTQTDGTVTVEIEGTADPDVVTAHVARVLSLDVDATGWDALGDSDELIARLQGAAPGLRPPLFYSAYEAAAWSVLSARRPRAQMTALRDRLNAAHGAGFTLAGREMHSFPTPEALLRVEAFAGLPEVKLRRLHGVARLALDGGLDTATLRALDPAEASRRVQVLDGIGPLYASLVVIRALGHTDVWPRDEPLVRAVLGELTGQEASPDEGEALATRWAPWRTWAAVFLRAAGPRLLPPDSAVGKKSVSR